LHLDQADDIVRCSGCKHPADLHLDNGCSAYSRGDNMRLPQPCDCYRDNAQARIAGIATYRHLYAVR